MNFEGQLRKKNKKELQVKREDSRKKSILGKARVTLLLFHIRWLEGEAYNYLNLCGHF